MQFLIHDQKNLAVRLIHIQIMPQIKAEKKFFLVRADKFFQNITFTIGKPFAITKFHEYKGFLKNVTGGEA